MKDFINKQLNPEPLIIFRFLFGLLLLIDVFSYWNIPFIDELILKPKLNFPYENLEFIKPLSLGAMKFLLALLTLSCIGIMLGKWFKASAIVFTLIYTYFFLIDKSYYNNHIYFIANLGFLFIFTNAAIQPFDKSNKKSTGGSISNWQLFIFQLMIFIVYTYGGIAKLNGDWLNGSITAKWLSTHPNIAFLQTKQAAMFFAISGAIFDLAIGFLLFIPRLRVFTFPLCIIFNINNAFLFDDISIFPYLMLGSLILFTDPEWIKNKLHFLINIATRFSDKESSKEKSMPAFLVVFVVFHLLFPFRGLLFDGKTDWTGKTNFFSWHMKSQFREVQNLTFYLSHDAHKEKIRVPVEEYLVYEQWYSMRFHPEMLVQFARFLKKDLTKKGIQNPVITASTMISFNGRPYQTMVDSTLNLAEIKIKPLEGYSWVAPLQP